ncbi:Rib/alpha-like domain-containing protein [Ligilactobacillus saerimneri]|uniref:Rib/alpha-like domain-containing protein n=1 Tax=Ligilactobacillus saerimneri TaxID=228229 RepID=UPI001C12015C|nr:Rib/alpha-like domain-containing protein [Ligilactobacillus saerimneri]MBU5308897.1 BspA family leucine-rich repeat surface protein [Ligilactobacillus saerimneri]
MRGGYSVSADELSNITTPTLTTTGAATSPETTDNQKQDTEQNASVAGKVDSQAGSEATPTQDKATITTEDKVESPTVTSPSSEKEKQLLTTEKDTTAPANDTATETSSNSVASTAKKNITMKAAPAPLAAQDQFSLVDWNYTVNEANKSVQLNQYIGSATSIRIAGLVETGQYQGYKVTMNKFNGDTWGTNSNNITDISFVAAADGTKAKFTGTWLTFNDDPTGNVSNELNNLAKVNLSGLDTSDVNSMVRAFASLQTLKKLDLKGIDTSNVTLMNHMFYNCTSLESLDLSNFDTSKVTDMSFMFSGCSSLDTLTFGENFNTSKVSTMSGMFQGCSNLQSLDVSKFNTSNVTNMSYMFGGCTKLQSLNLSNFSTSSVTNMDYMFWSCSSLTSLDVSTFDTSKVKRMNGMFERCKNLRSLDLSNFNTSSVTNTWYLFYGCLNLKALDISGFDMSKVQIIKNFWDGDSNLRLVNMANLTMDKLSTAAQSGLKNALNNRTGAVAIVAEPDVFNLVKSDNSGTVIGPHFNAGGESADGTVGKFADGTTVTSVVKSQNINPNDLYASLPQNQDELKVENIAAPSRNSYSFTGWQKQDGATNDLQELHLKNYPLNFDTVDYNATYTDNLTNILPIGVNVGDQIGAGDSASAALSDADKEKNNIASITWANPISTTLSDVGEKTYPATITFADGSTRTIEVKVKVTSAAQRHGNTLKQLAETAQVTTDVGVDPKLDVTKILNDEEKNANEVDTIVWDSNNKFDTSLEKAAENPVSYDVIVTFNDGSTVTIQVPVKIVTDAEQYGAKIIAETVGTNVGVTPDVTKALTDEVKNNNDVASIVWDSKVAVDTSVAASEKAPVEYDAIVTFKDGSTVTIKVKVKVVSDAQKYGANLQPEAQAVETDVNGTPDVTKALTEEAKKANEVKAIEWVNAGGIDTSLAAASKAPVYYEAKVTFNDGSTVTIQVPVKIVTDAEQYSAKIIAETVGTDVGVTPDVTKALTDEVKKANAVKAINWVNAGGIDTSLAAASKAPVSYEAKVTFNDGSTTTIKVPVKIVTEAEQYGSKITAETVGTDVGVTPNVTKALTDEVKKANAVKAINWVNASGIDTSLVATGKESVSYEAKVTFNDGSTLTIQVPVKVISNAQKHGDDLKHLAETAMVTTDAGVAPKAEEALTADDKTKNEIKAIEWANVNEIDISSAAAEKEPVAYDAIVTFNDGSTTTIKVKVKVISDAQKYGSKITTETVTTDVGIKPDASKALTEANQDQYEVKEIAWKNVDGINTNLDAVGNDQAYQAVVTFNDGSTTTIRVKVKVVSDAQKHDNDIAIQAVTTNLNEKPDVTQALKGVDLTGSHISGIEWKEPTKINTDLSAVGNDTAYKATISFNDGSTKEVDVVVKVIDNRLDSEKYGDKISVSDITVNLDEKPDVTQALKGVDLTGSHISGIEWKEPTKINTDLSAVGNDTAYKATISFNDGSTKEVDVLVKVIDNREDKDKYTPTINVDPTVKKGEQVDPESMITNKDDLPGGTKIEWGTEPDTTKPGESTGKLVITYPDGSHVELPVTVTVEEWDNEKYTPTINVDTTVKKGDQIDPEAVVTNKDDLPGGTKIEWGTEPNTDTPGESTGKLIITYPDGSHVELPVTVTVEEWDNEKYTPTINVDPTVKKGDQIDPEAVVTNKDDLPQGTTIEWKEAPDTTKQGESSGKLVVIYPDGTNVEISVTVQVKDVIPWTPLEPGHKDCAEDSTSDTSYDQNGTQDQHGDKVEQTVENTDRTKANAKATTNSAKKSSRTLPQTGDETPANADLVGAVLASLGLLGLGVTRRRKHN